MFNEAFARLQIKKEAFELINELEKQLKDVFTEIEKVETLNQAKVLAAFQKNHVAAHYFNPTTGYGYDDVGRDNLDKVFADAFGTESAVASPQIISGTHAIFIVLSGLLKHGDCMLSISGRPYDTLVDAIGIGSESLPNSLRERGIFYEQVDLSTNGRFKLDEICAKVERLKPRIAYIQRSRGYEWRESLLPEDMKPIIKAIKRISPDTVVVVDNCYGEFTCINEPTDYGADIIVASLIKNAGGGLAPTGGYFAGKKEYVERISYAMTVPGIGRECGSYSGSYLPFYQGLFSAPHVVAQSLKTSALFAKLFEHLNLPTMPSSTSKRSDIVQALRFNTKEELIAFCKCIQSVSPVDGHVVPEPWDMPGYSDQVIMAAGTFVQGASIELTADAPIHEPYTGYIQGALNYAHGKLAAMRVLSELMNR